MQRLLILSISVALVYAKTTYGDTDEGQSSSSSEVDHGDKGYSFGDGKSSQDEETDQGSFEKTQSGFDEKQGETGFEQEDVGSQDGGDDAFGGGFQGQDSNEGFERSKGYQSDDGESEGTYDGNRKSYE